MKNKISKTEARKIIQEFFSTLNGKSPKDIKKIKRFAMRYNIPLKNKRKRFCKSCYTPYKNPKIRIKKGVKSITCRECDYTTRWKINSF